eukprot:TRINITY_DN71236_c0_g1_i1.p2 TRINITY_DN71236_c0_g1~~TRINITY_DN71236_c0_g1_i1.p2  ORF type:complete len:190 (-),score=25.24 TRINITY_DN71236_c0_g1_i1:309-878(-)
MPFVHDSVKKSHNVDDASHLTKDLLKAFERRMHRKSIFTKDLLEAFQRSIDAVPVSRDNIDPTSTQRSDLRNRSDGFRQSARHADDTSTLDSLSMVGVDDPWDGVQDVIDDNGDDSNDSSSTIVNVRGLKATKSSEGGFTRDSLSAIGVVRSSEEPEEDADVSEEGCSSTIANVRVAVPSRSLVRAGRA